MRAWAEHLPPRERRQKPNLCQGERIRGRGGAATSALVADHAPPVGLSADVPDPGPLVVVNALNCLIFRRCSRFRPRSRLLRANFQDTACSTAIIATVDACTRRAVQVIGIAVHGHVSGVYAARHFAIDADVDKLISKDLPWRQREAAFDRSFPSQEEPSWRSLTPRPLSLLPTTSALIQKLSGHTKLSARSPNSAAGDSSATGSVPARPAGRRVHRGLGEASPSSRR